MGSGGGVGGFEQADVNVEAVKVGVRFCGFSSNNLRAGGGLKANIALGGQPDPVFAHELDAGDGAGLHRGIVGDEGGLETADDEVIAVNP